MRRNFHKRLEQLERISEATPRARGGGFGQLVQASLTMIHESLGVHGIDQQPGESLAATVGRTLGMTGPELREAMGARAYGH